MRFTQGDVQRALRGARAGGMEPDEVLISPDGEIRVRAKREHSGDAASILVRDEIEKHFHAKK